MSVDAVNRYLQTTVGREKLLRFVQYFSRFYAFYLLRTGAPKEAIQRWGDLKGHIGNGRKFFRLLKQLEFAQAGYKALSVQDEVLKVTAVLKQAGMFFYYCTEAVVLANAVNFYKVAKIKDIQQIGFKCWLTALTMSVISTLYKFRNLSIRAEQLEKTFKSEKSSEQLVSFDEGIVGLAGMTTSWLAMTSQWKKVAA
ncbi:peroxisomal biogenesis factor 11 [Zychaea mexicana]|uniref:peroxisomal biogenesis factor 11 n=1 Tax=Zychaea mexicana TaxID=64656 RepID=UPI0022FF37E5|nr:peroxisomal biogenesis factor 11 [Zychaea mexicana]KAI9494194.1 peroxisomal biogenesis factor 11 [Zychaea mexicana]